MNRAIFVLFLIGIYYRCAGIHWLGGAMSELQAAAK
jgi:hypothetical protein